MSNVKKCWGRAILVGVISGGVGAFFGAGAQSLYNLEPSNLGVIAGAIGGVIVGVCYMSGLVSMRDRFTEESYLCDFAGALGVAAGIVFSIIVHIVLLILSDDKNAGGIVIGMPFGVFAGGILGWVIGLFMEVRAQEVLEV